MVERGESEKEWLKRKGSMIEDGFNTTELEKAINNKNRRHYGSEKFVHLVIYPHNNILSFFNFVYINTFSTCICS